MEIPVSHTISAEDARKITAEYEAKCKQNTLDSIYTAIRKAAGEGKSQVIFSTPKVRTPAEYDRYKKYSKVIFEALKVELLSQGFEIPISSWSDTEFSLTISWAKED